MFPFGVVIFFLYVLSKTTVFGKCLLRPKGFWFYYPIKIVNIPKALTSTRRHKNTTCCLAASLTKTKWFSESSFQPRKNLLPIANPWDHLCRSTSKFFLMLIYFFTILFRRIWFLIKASFLRWPGPPFMCFAYLNLSCKEKGYAKLNLATLPTSVT